MTRTKVACLIACLGVSASCGNKEESEKPSSKVAATADENATPSEAKGESPADIARPSAEEKSSEILEYQHKSVEFESHGGEIALDLTVNLTTGELSYTSNSHGEAFGDTEAESGNFSEQTTATGTLSASELASWKPSLDRAIESVKTTTDDCSTEDKFKGEGIALTVKYADRTENYYCQYLGHIDLKESTELLQAVILSDANSERFSVKTTK